MVSMTKTAIRTHHHAKATFERLGSLGKEGTWKKKIRILALASSRRDACRSRTWSRIEASAGGEKESKRRGPSTNRVVYGALAGAVALSCIGAGGWAFAGFAAVSVYHATQEYFGFVTAQGISQGMEPPTRAVSAATSALCVSAVLMTQIFQGRSGAALAISGFGILTMNLLQSNKPRFSQLASSIFGLFYCGFLPSFWLKMRAMNAPIPAIKSGVLAAAAGDRGISVGLAATFLSVVCVIAADTGAYFGGKTYGRTQLISISPKKTWEGAVAGLLSSMVAALGVGYAVLGWPASPTGAVLLSVITFFGSVFGDLIESTMKRDAGLKDSGNLIPGHGGILDRADGYMFTGSLVYAFVKYLLPLL